MKFTQLFRKNILVLTFILLLANSVFADWIWTKKTSLPFGGKRDRAISFSINGFGFVGTGLDSLNLVQNDLWRYDTSSNSWMQMADFPGVPRRDAVAFVIDSFAFVGCGIDDSSAWGNTLMDFYKYDPDLNTWDSIAPYSNGTAYGVYKAVGITVAGKGYVTTGRYYGIPFYQTWVYDPPLDTWIQKSDFPNFAGRNGATGFSINNKLYLTTGSDDNYYYNDLWEYDLALDVWTQKQDFPGSKRIGAVAFTIDTLGIVGTGSDGGYTDDFWSYNATDNHWSYVNQFPGGARRGATGFPLGKYGYLACGKSENGTKRDLWQLKYVAPQLPNNVPTVTPSKIFTLYPNVVSVNSTVLLNNVPAGNSSISIFSSDGKLLQQFNQSTKDIFISSEVFTASGEYFIELKTVTPSVVSQIQKLIVL